MDAITEGSSGLEDPSTSPAGSTTRRRSDPARIVVAVATEVVLLGGAAALIAWFGRHWTFLRDDWGFVFYRRSGGATAYFAPFHGHLFAGVIALYNVLFATVGLRHHGAYTGVEIALNLLCALLLFLYAIRRRVSPALAIVASSLLVVLGPAWEDLFWLAGAGFVIAVICLLATLLAWERPVRGANLVTFLLACVALGSHNTGVPVVAGLVVASFGRGPDVRRLAALGLPLAGWLVWFTALRGHLTTPAALRAVPGAAPRGDVGVVGSFTAHLSHLPSWLVRAGTGAFGAMAGHPTWTALGVLLALATLGAGAWAWRRGTLDRWRVAGVTVAVVGFWVATGVSRSTISSPYASRYLYPGVALLVVLLVECARALPVGKPAVAAICLLAVGALYVHVDVLRQQSDATASVFAKERITLSWLESCRGRISPSTVVVQDAPAGPFWAATAALGNPVPPVPPAVDPLCPPRPTASGGG